MARWTYDKAPVNTHRETQTHKDERNLVYTSGSAVPVISFIQTGLAKSAGPTDTKVMGQPGTQRVDHGRGQGPDEHVMIRKLGFDEMCRDDLADGVCVHEADIERKGDQVMVEDVWLQ